MNRDIIEVFLQQMRQDHGDDIEAIELPEGTRDYVLECIALADAETLTFMIKPTFRPPTAHFRNKAVHRIDLTAQGAFVARPEG